MKVKILTVFISFSSLWPLGSRFCEEPYRGVCGLPRGFPRHAEESPAVPGGPRQSGLVRLARRSPHPEALWFTGWGNKHTKSLSVFQDESRRALTSWREVLQPFLQSEPQKYIHPFILVFHSKMEKCWLPCFNFSVSRCAMSPYGNKEEKKIFSFCEIDLLHRCFSVKCDHVNWWLSANYYRHIRLIVTI